MGMPPSPLQRLSARFTPGVQRVLARVGSEITPATEPPPDLPARRVTAAGVLIVVVVCLFWLAPIAYVGSAKGDVRFMPMYLKHIQRIACLFTHSVRSWKSYHVQYQVPGDPPEHWRELDHLDAFQLNIFGYRTRIHRILGHAYKKNRGRLRTAELATFIKDKLEAGEGPSGQPEQVQAMRFIRAWHPVAELAQEEGRYTKPSLDDIPEKRWQIYGERRWDGRRATHP
jgi:hypothetical protein